MKEIYIVYENNGLDYENHIEFAICAFESEKDAHDFVNNRLKEFKEDNERYIKLVWLRFNVITDEEKRECRKIRDKYPVAELGMGSDPSWSVEKINFYPSNT